MDVSSRFPGLVVLALVVVAAAMLLAGFGAAVGVGLLVGLALGCVVVLTVVARQPAGAVSFLRTGPRGPEPDHELIMRHGREQLALSPVDASDLRRVLAGPVATDAAGVRVELIALELRADGGIATLAARARPPAAPGHFVEVAVSDDVGTAYVAAGQGPGGGPNPAVGRIELRFAPAPPPAARRLTLRIDAFVDPFPAPARRLPAPWTLVVDLAEDGT